MTKEQEKARQLYLNTDDKKVRKSLIDIFGKDLFVYDICDKIKDFSDVCDILRVKKENYDFMTKEHRDRITSYDCLVLVAEAYNEGWKAMDIKNNHKYNDTVYYGYTPLFDVRGKYFGYVGLSVCNLQTTPTPLWFKNQKLAYTAGKKFAYLYKCYLLGDVADEFELVDYDELDAHNQSRLENLTENEKKEE
jgi:hypothetical protein